MRSEFPVIIEAGYGSGAVPAITHFYCNDTCQLQSDLYDKPATEPDHYRFAWQKPTETCNQCQTCNRMIPVRGTFVVAVYDCGQRFGGREEGGWWYDTGSLVRIVKVFKVDQSAYAYSQRLNKKLQSRNWGPNEGKPSYTSVLSDGEYQAHTYQDNAPAGFPEERPRYE